MTPQPQTRAAAIPHFPVVAFAVGLIATVAALVLTEILLLAPLLP